MTANQYKKRPAPKTYIAANGHVMDLAFRFSRHTGWYPVYSLSTHSASCPCSEYNVSEYAGEDE